MGHAVGHVVGHVVGHDGQKDLHGCVEHRLSKRGHHPLLEGHDAPPPVPAGHEHILRRGGCAVASSVFCIKRPLQRAREQWHVQKLAQL